MQHAIWCEDLAVRYRSKKGDWIDAVRGLSFHVKPGEVVGFLGPNGAGKSSTLKVLMGFVAPHSGTASIFGHRAGDLESRKKAGYLPEVAMYYPFLTPLETLTMYGELQGLRGKSLRTEANELLELVGLKNALYKQNRTLSKGMLQRVGIAQSLLGSPDLLILDEVTSGLDPVGRKELRNLLLERKNQGATLFFSSHELSEVSLICDRILLIHKGKLVEERKLSELQSSLLQFSVQFSGPAALFDLATDVATESEGLFRASFAEKSKMLEAITRIQHSGGQILDLIAQEGSLEDYFIETVGGVDLQEAA